MSAGASPKMARLEDILWIVAERFPRDVKKARNLCRETREDERVWRPLVNTIPSLVLCRAPRLSWIVSLGGLINTVDWSNNLVLHKAAEVGDVETTREALRLGADARHRNDDYATAIDVAYLHDQWEVGKVLAEAFLPDDHRLCMWVLNGMDDDATVWSEAEAW